MVKIVVKPHIDQQLTGWKLSFSPFFSCFLAFLKNGRRSTNVLPKHARYQLRHTPKFTVTL